MARKIRRHGSKRGGRHLILKISLAALFLGIALFIGTAVGAAYLLTRDLPKLENPDSYRLAQSSQIFDSHGHLLVTLHGEENRFIVKLKSVPKDLQRAIVAIEDQRFYKHKGIDYEGIFRAIFADVESGKVVEGGSTITQQYVKNIYITREKTLTRKMREAALAWQLEKVWPKNKILEKYLNTIYFGQNAYGVQAASLTYFGKSVYKLNLAQCALLAALPRSPLTYSPYTHPKAAFQRRNLVIRKMLKLRFITPAQAKLAVKQKLGVVETPGSVDNYPAPYFVDYVKQLLIKRYGANFVFKGGLRVYTTINLKLQRYAEEAIEDVLNESGDPTGALVAIDPKTGHILAMVGGKNFKKFKFNLATQGHRQPGSAFKPFVLTTALKDGIALSKRYESAPQHFDLPGHDWEVRNYDDHYRGKINLLTATEFSDNTVFAQLAMDVGPKRIAYTAERMGIQTRLQGNPAMALGGLRTGVTPLEMASAYSTLASRGVYHLPTPITKIAESNGRLIWRAKVVDKPIFRHKIADLVNYALMKVIQNGTGRRADIGRPAAGKTGTTTDYHDAWFAGYTPDLVACVWMGYPRAQIAMRDVHGIRVAGGTLPAEIWAKFMENALEEVRPSEFVLPESEVTWVLVCKESGMRATDACPQTEKEPFLKGSEPDDFCTIHKSLTAPHERVTIKICSVSGKMATPNCPEDKIVRLRVSTDEIPGYCPIHGNIKKAVTVPSVLGKTIDEAKSLIHEAGFSTYTVWRHSEADEGTVFAQSPSGGVKAPKGVTVTLVVSKGN